jgi:hypothetical protein
VSESIHQGVRRPPIAEQARAEKHSRLPHLEQTLSRLHLSLALHHLLHEHKNTTPPIWTRLKAVEVAIVCVSVRFSHVV